LHGPLRGRKTRRLVVQTEDFLYLWRAHQFSRLGVGQYHSALVAKMKLSDRGECFLGEGRDVGGIACRYEHELCLVELVRNLILLRLLAVLLFIDVLASPFAVVLGLFLIFNSAEQTLVSNFSAATKRRIKGIRVTVKVPRLLIARFVVVI
jgi:hypothetical protein